VGEVALRGKIVDLGKEFVFRNTWWSRVLLVGWGGSAELLVRWRVVFGLLEELSEEDLAKDVVVDTIIEPTRDVGNGDVNALFLPLGCDAANVVVEVAGKLGHGLIEVFKRKFLEEQSMSLDIVGIDWQSVRVSSHCTAKDRVQKSEDALTGAWEWLDTRQRARVVVELLQSVGPRKNRKVMIQTADGGVLVCSLGVWT
jgi:hypothetical protein